MREELGVDTVRRAALFFLQEDVPLFRISSPTTMFRANKVLCGNILSEANFNKMLRHIKKRDPNERHLRTGHLFIEMMKRFYAYFIALGVVVFVNVRDQLENPASVRVPVHDGRSLVT